MIFFFTVITVATFITKTNKIPSYGIGIESKTLLTEMKLKTKKTLSVPSQQNQVLCVNAAQIHD